jgi:voltage-gated potassium channel
MPAAASDRDRLRRLAERLEPLTGVLALLVIPALLIETSAASGGLQRLGRVINWTVWLGFCLEFGLFFAADPGWRTVRRRWLDLTVIIIAPPFLVPEYLESARTAPAVRLIRLLRFARLGLLLSVGLRQFRQLAGHRRFHFVGAVGFAVVLLGALGVFLVEGDVNPSVSSFGNAVWWAIVTATTVGYGDVSPVSTEGRLIAVVLMLTGIGVIGVFTATVASFFLEPDVAETQDVVARLDAIERKLDQLLLAQEREDDLANRR